MLSKNSIPNNIAKLKKFRQSIYGCIRYRSDACLDLIDSLCSNTFATTPVQLSINPLHRRTYNSITDVLSEFHKDNNAQDENLLNTLVEQVTDNNDERDYYLFATDCTPMPRVYSKTLSDRGVVYSPNAVLNNKPVTIGHKYSVTTFLPPKNINSPPWVLPLITQRVQTSVDEVLLGASQVKRCIDKIKAKEPNKLCVNVADSAYCKPEYIEQLHGDSSNNTNLVSILRARSNRVVWSKAKETRSIYTGKRGHELWYGNKFCFHNEDTWHKPDNFIQEVFTGKRTKEYIVTIQVWNDMLMRQKRSIKMNEQPFSLYRITACNIEGKQIFHKPLWLMVFGNSKDKLTPQQVYRGYLQRYDIEHFFKFKKNNLLSDKIQSPDTQHEENWWSICSLAYSMLFASRELVDKICRPWEKYLPESTNIDRLASPSQVQRAFYKLTCMIGTPAKSPKARGNPLGRDLGQAQVKRTRHPVLIKSRKTAKEAFG